MATEKTFQMLLIFTGIALIILLGYNLVSMGVSRNKFYTKTEGIPILVLRAVLPDASMIGMLVYSINPRLMAWSSLPMPYWLRWVGFVTGVSALLLFFWVLRSLGNNYSTTLTIQKNQTLVSHGPYQWVRHPLYTSFILIWLGFFFISANWFIGLTGIGGFVLVSVLRTPKEEQMMISRFGDEYSAYMKRTGRFLPRWGGGKGNKT
jgi:protein-S-isoprenylcysteine O-methyltransferase Ste14